MRLSVIRNFSVLVTLLLIAGWIGFAVGQKQLSVSVADKKINFAPVTVDVTSKTPTGDKAKTVDMSLFWDVWDKVLVKYVDKSKVDPQKMVYGAIAGMVNSLDDPYSLFLPPTKNSESKADLNGQFEGIGAQLGMKEQRIIVVAPLAGSPSERAGIKAGDWIIKVDGSETTNWTLPEAISKIRGRKGTTVKLTILHEKASKPEEIPIIRDTIQVPSVEFKIVESTASGSLKKALYVRLSRFGEDTDNDWDKIVAQVVTAMSVNDKLVGLVLDLRNNPGGYLQSAVYVASEFLPSGTVVEQVNYKGESIVYSVNRKGKLTKIPMVTIVNQGSASASEILSGSLQARNRAKVVGVKSFGKGSVQEAEELINGAGLHLTTAKWLLPNGEWINGKGLTPDVIMDNDEFDPTKDKQLEKAIESLGK